MKIKITLTLILLLFLLAAVLYVSSEQAHQRAEQKLSELFATPVSFSSMSLKFMPDPALSISGLVIYRRQDNRPFITADSITLSFAMEPLLYHHLIMANASFDTMQILLPVKKSGEKAGLLSIRQGHGLLSLGDNKLVCSDWQYALYDGTAIMDAVISPLNNISKIGFDGTLQAHDIRLQPLLDDATGKHSVSGILSGHLLFSLALTDTIRNKYRVNIDGPVLVQDGQWFKKGAGRSASGSVLSKEPAPTDSFDSVSMQLHMRNQIINATHLKIVAHHFHAVGKLRMNAEHQLYGELNTSTAASVIGIKLLVRGSMADPDVYPAPSSAIAGVLGGVFAGPVGAVVGVRFGGMVGTMLESIADAFSGIFHSDQPSQPINH